MNGIYFKSLRRSLLTNKAFNFLNIGGLAIGIACAGLIFLWVADELTFDHNNIKKDRLYSVQINVSFGGNSFTMGSTPRVLAASIKNEIPGIANACRISDQDQNALFTVKDRAVYASGRFADPSLFKMLSFHFLKGNAANPFTQFYSLVLTESGARKFFGNDSNVIGKTLRVNNEQNYTVTGLVKDMPGNSTLQFEWLAPYEAQMQQQLIKTGHPDLSWNSYGPLTYIELEPTANLAGINQKLYHYIHGKDNTQKSTAFLYPMSDWHLYDEFANGRETGGGHIRQVQLLSVVAWIILIIACINFMNLATARSERRAKEIGMRKILGSGRKRLITQFIGEAMIMSAIATCLALILVMLSLPSFNILVQKKLSLGLTNPLHLLFLSLITILCGLLAGSYPALYLSSFNATQALKGLKIKTGNANLIRQGLVVFQFAISIVFIISTSLVYLQVELGRDRNLGFNRANLLEIDMQHGFAERFSTIKQELLNTGLVENAAVADHTILDAGNSDNAFRWQGKARDNDVDITFRNVNSDFISTSGMHIAAGRDFTSVASDTSTVIVNRSLANVIDKNGVLGKILQSPRGQKEGMYKDLRIVGVVDDYVFGNMYGNSSPVLFFCRPLTKNFDNYGNLLYVRIKEQRNSQETLSQIAAVIKKNNPAYPFQYKFVDEQFNAKFLNEILMSKLSRLFAILAILISCLGLFSLATYTAERRLKEISIRKVLGASVTGLAGLLSKDFLLLVLISCVLAFPAAALIMYNWLQNYQYRIHLSWWIFALAGLGAMIIALVTVSFQAIRAAMMNPVKTLRTE